MTYEDGQFHMLESLEIPGTAYTKHHTDPVGIHERANTIRL